MVEVNGRRERSELSPEAVVERRNKRFELEGTDGRAMSCRVLQSSSSPLLLCNSSKVKAPEHFSYRLADSQVSLLRLRRVSFAMASNDRSVALPPPSVLPYMFVCSLLPSHSFR